jgi:tRNA-uridine 2-sulfurtransferase
VRVLVAMSGGVDSSVAAGLLAEQGHEVVGATLKLWGGPSDSGCCSVSDVEDARAVARRLGVPHHVFNMSELFEQRVVDPYVAGHRRGETPNPCIECNRHVKFGALADRARRLGFDALATGHHARVAVGPDGARLLRGADRDKDQSYVLCMLSSRQLGSVVFPVGVMHKDEVRAWAQARHLPTAAKPDSQDVCFIHSASGRSGFLAGRMALHDAVLVDEDSGAEVGVVPAVELVTVGQRRGLGLGTGGRRRFALAVDVGSRRITVGDSARARSPRLAVAAWHWAARPVEPGARALAQTSAHGVAVPCMVSAGGLDFDEPQRLVAPGQTVALYDAADPEAVVGSGIAVQLGTAEQLGTAVRTGAAVWDSPAPGGS